MGKGTSVVLLVLSQDMVATVSRVVPCQTFRDLASDSWYLGGMELTSITLAMLLSLPPAYIDREEVGHEARMQVIASAIAHASHRATCTDAYEDFRCKPIWNGPGRELAAMLITKGWWESRFVSNVHAGKCKVDECDAIKLENGIVVHRARSPWQIQRTSYSESLWDKIIGDDFEATRNAAWVATRILSDGKKKCKSSLGTLSWYGIQRCHWSGARNRHHTFVKILKTVH